MYNRCSLERLQMERSTEGGGSETSKEIEITKDKKLVEDQVPANSNQTLSESNNASKGKKNFKTKTRTERQGAKSADITHYFHRLPN